MQALPKDRRGFYGRNISYHEYQVDRFPVCDILGRETFLILQEQTDGEAKTMSFTEYMKYSLDKKLDMQDASRDYFDGLTHARGVMHPLLLYGVSMSSRITKNPFFNLSDINSVLSRAHRSGSLGSDFIGEGVVSPYLYYGSSRSTFAWHTEDMDLCSINIVLDGNDKEWYIVPSKDRQKFQFQLDAMLSQSGLPSCRNILCHKSAILPDTVFESLEASAGIKITRVVQKKGQGVVTFPGTPHFGFNHGINVAEAVNFGTRSWISHGLAALHCSCGGASEVTFPMNGIVREYEPALATKALRGFVRDPSVWSLSKLNWDSSFSASVIDESAHECSWCDVLRYEGESDERKLGPF